MHSLATLGGVGILLALPARCLALDIDDVALGELCCRRHIVVATKRRGRHLEELCQRLVAVASLCHDVVRAIREVDIVAVVGIYRHAEVVGVDAVVGIGGAVVAVCLILLVRLMRLGLGGLCLRGSAWRGCYAQLRGDVVVVELYAISLVEEIEVLLLDKLDKALGIVGGGGIPRCLETLCPTQVVVGVVGEERLIALVVVQKLGVVGVRLGDGGVGTETLALLVDMNWMDILKLLIQIQR